MMAQRKRTAMWVTVSQTVKYLQIFILFTPVYRELLCESRKGKGEAVVQR
jgi:hypothetical protein